MKQLFLTSSVEKVARDIVAKLDLSIGNKLVFITTPAEPKGELSELEWLAHHRQSLFDAGFAVTDYTITGKSAEQLQQDLATFEYIYMSGGDTYHVLEQAQKSGFIPLLQNWIAQGKTYISTSAGSISAGPRCPAYLLHPEAAATGTSLAGFNLVNFTIVPHWGRPDFRRKYLDSRLAIAYQADQVPLLLLTDNQYVHVQDDHLQIIDVT
jgi:dipeptidase E